MSLLKLKIWKRGYIPHNRINFSRELSTNRMTLRVELYNFSLHKFRIKTDDFVILHFPCKKIPEKHKQPGETFLFTSYSFSDFLKIVTKMENDLTICKNFGLVPCGQKNIDTLKIENTSKNRQVLVAKSERGKSQSESENLQIHPLQVAVQPGQAARFTLTYISHLEDIIENFRCTILQGEQPVARVNIRAQSQGPSLCPKVYNLKFFYFRNVVQTVKRIEIVNKTKCEAKFCFDLDEDYQHLDISQTQGVITPGQKLGLKLTFRPSEPGIYYKRIFCIVQYHEPIIFNILAVCKPKLKIEPKELKFTFPKEEHFANNYNAYMARMKPVKVPEEEKCHFSKCCEEYEIPANEKAEEVESVKKCWSVPLDTISQMENQQSSDNLAEELYLTTRYVDIKNSSEVLKATTLINLSKTQLYYFEWDHDPKNHFRIDPRKGFLQPSAKIHFSIYFTPSTLDFLYHIEVDVKIFPCHSEVDDNATKVIDLPQTIALRINGHSFPDDSCGWVPQCKITQKTLRLRSCVPDEVMYGTFMIERHGHLPVTFNVLPPKDPNYVVQPPFGYLSKNFQLFVVRFSSESKEEGIYIENLKIKFNTSNSNCQTIKLVTSVEVPKLIFGKDNSLTFPSIFPGTKASAIISIENPTNLHLSYEFVTPDDITWAEVVNPKGLIEPKSFGEIELVFKPETPCEYLDYIPCHISSTSKPDCTQIIHLQLIGSCQYGYLVATPSSHDFGESVYLQEKSFNLHLFNFSPSLLHFRLRAVHRAFPVGDPEIDVRITPNRGSVPPKGSLELKVTIIPHNIDIIQYAIVCQNLEDDSEEASPREDPRKIFLLRFEGVRPAIQILDVNLIGGGPLFSPHWLWKMLNIDRINKALKSTSLHEEIRMKFPTAMMGSDPITLGLLIGNNRHGEITWRVRQEILCPCLEASEVNMVEPLQCRHSAMVNVFPSKTSLGANETITLQLNLNYEDLSECTYVWTLELPHDKNVVLKAPAWSLPSIDTPLISTYLNSNFRLNPVFIGDPQPPQQLFWLYNNTSQPSSYVVENVTLWEPVAVVQQILDCLNPSGVIPPISSLPLRFLFKPMEIKSYTARVVLLINQSTRKMILHVTGEGVPNPQSFQELSIPKTIPNKSILENSEIAVKCGENFINIPFCRIFSKMERIFFLRNHSASETWSFRWHSFRVQDVVSAKIIPAEGVIKPGLSAMMTLVMKTFSCATFISISIPCDVINYSELIAYESSVRYRGEMTEKAKDYFTITEKGISFDEPNMQITEKPEPFHIFITINTNIISSLYIDTKISQQRQSILSAENEVIPGIGATSSLTPAVLPSIQQVLENLLWNVLISGNFEENIKKLHAAQDYNYLQILPESRKKNEEIIKRFLELPRKSQLQRFMERDLKEMLRQNFSSVQND